MVSAESLEAGLRNRLLEADAPPAPKPLRVTLPESLRSVMHRDLPDDLRPSVGRPEVTAATTETMLESLALLAQAMQNDLSAVQSAFEPTAPSRVEEDDLRSLLDGLRSH